MSSFLKIGFVHARFGSLVWFSLSVSFSQPKFQLTNQGYI